MFSANEQIYKRSTRNYNDKPCLLQALSILIENIKVPLTNKKRAINTDSVYNASKELPATSIQLIDPKQFTGIEFFPD